MDFRPSVHSEHQEGGTEHIFHLSIPLTRASTWRDRRGMVKVNLKNEVNASLMAVDAKRGALFGLRVPVPRKKLDGRIVSIAVRYRSLPLGGGLPWVRMCGDGAGKVSIPGQWSSYWLGSLGT